MKMDKTNLIRIYKKYTKQKHNKVTDEKIKTQIENLHPDVQQVVFDLICISPLFQPDFIQKEEEGYSVNWELLPAEIKQVVVVYLEKLH